MKTYGASPLRRTIEGTLQVFLAESLVLPTGLVITVFLTRWLGPAGYGLFILAANLVGWVQWGVVSLFSRATVKFVGEAADWRPIAGAVVRLQFFFASIALFLLWAFADPLSTLFREPVLADYFRLFALEVPLFCLFFAQQHILVGLGRFRERAWTSAVRWISRLLFILVFVGLGLSVPGAILGGVAASLLALLMVRLTLRLPLFGSTSSPAKDMWAYALPLFFSALSLRLYERLDLFVLKVLGASASLAGIYGAAQSLSWIPGLFALSFSPLIISTLSRLLWAQDMASAREVTAQSLRIVLWLWPFAGLASGAAPQLTDLVLGPGFSDSAPLFALLIFAGVAMANISVGTAIIVALGKPKMTAALTGPMVPLVLVGHLILIPRWGGLGAAVATTSVALLGALITSWVVFRYWQIPPPYGTIWRTTLLCGVIFALSALWPAAGLVLLLKLILLGSLILAGFLLLGELGRGELPLLRQVIRRGAGGG